MTALHRHESKKVDLMAISCRNTVCLDQGWMKIIVDMDWDLLQGFHGAALTRLPLDVRDSNQRNREAEVDAYVRA